MSAQANYFRVKLLNTTEEGCTIPDVELLCKARSVLGKMGRFILVGDYVQVINIDWQGARGLVSNIQERKSEILNPKISNVDHFALVFALADPPFEPFQVTRFLVAAESVGIPCSLLLNKADLVDQATIDANVARAREWGYSAIPVSVESGQGLAGLKALLVDRTTVLAGPSGVGKSSIINYLRREALSAEQQRRLQVFQERMDTEYDWRTLSGDDDPLDADEHVGCSDDDDAEEPTPSATHAQQGQQEEDDTQQQERVASAASASASGAAAAGGKGRWAGVARHDAPAVEALEYHVPVWASGDDKIYGAQAVGNVGYRSRRGRHTTRNVVLLDLPGGGILADTPGFNYPSIQQVTEASLQSHFPEIRAIQAERPCAFANCTHVHEPNCAVRAAPWERYEFYVRLLEEVREREETENTKLQMHKRRRQGMVKRQQNSRGADIEVARLDPKKHRRSSRNSRKLGVKDMLNSNNSEDA